ncbi:MAG: class I SAM-dependent methyltransferase [Parcubacteria group bacterium]|nr:class I SAM-dependent methyltransferase [Parcubacteria group bacterium]
MPLLNFWRLYALIYDSLLKIIPYRQLIEKVVAELEIKSDLTIFDAGCGTGNVIKKIEEKYSGDFKIKIHAIDVETAMLNRAVGKIKKNHVRFWLCDLNEGLPFPNKTFHRIICVNALYALNNPDLAIQRFRRVLKNKGEIIIVNPCSKNLVAILKEHIFIILSKKNIISFLKFLIDLPLFVLLIVFNIIILFKAKKKIYHFLSEKILAEKMSKFGFKILKLEKVYGSTCVFLKAQKI